MKIKPRFIHLRRACVLLATLICGQAHALQSSPLDLSSLGPAAQPSVSVDAASGSYVLSWQSRLDDGCVALRVAELDREGELGPVYEVARGCDWFVNWADFPSLLVADNGDWLSYWLRKTGAATYAYEIRVSRSTDHGMNWSAPIVPHDDGTPTEHGFVSMAPVSDDKVLLLWLDGRRNAETPGSSGDDEHEHEGSMALRSAVLGRDGLLTEQVEIDQRVCSCCGTDLLRRADGEHLAVFRDRSSEEIRDIGLIRRGADGWSGQALVNADGWKIAGCPVNGPALAARDDSALAAWTTMSGDEFAVRARILGENKAFQTMEQGSEVRGRVDAASFAEGWLLSWLGSAEQNQASLRLAQLSATGEPGAALEVTRLIGNRDIGMPRLASLGDHAVLVWTEVSDAPRAEDGRAKTQLRGVQLVP